MDLTPQFLSAANDYLYLLEKKYPQKAIIKLIGDRYSLSGVERTMIYRGLTTSDNKTFRSSVLLPEQDIKEEVLHIDGYNVLITIGSYLNGSLVFVANDNYLRDASEVHGKVFRQSLYDRGIQLIIDYLLLRQVHSVQLYFDEPVSKSGLLAAKVKDKLNSSGLKGSAQTVNSPDYNLKTLDSGIVCSSGTSGFGDHIVTLGVLTKLCAKPRFVTPNFTKRGGNIGRDYFVMGVGITP